MQREKKRNELQTCKYFSSSPLPVHAFFTQLLYERTANEKIYEPPKSLFSSSIDTFLFGWHFTRKFMVKEKSVRLESLIFFQVFFLLPPAARERRRQSEIFFSCLTRAKLFIFKPLVSFAVARCVFEEPRNRNKIKSKFKQNKRRNEKFSNISKLLKKIRSSSKYNKMRKICL